MGHRGEPVRCGRRAVQSQSPRPERELYDLRTDPTETNNLLADDDTGDMDAIAADLAVRLHDWRQRTGDVIPSDFAGTRIAMRYTETYLRSTTPDADQPVGDRRRPRHRGVARRATRLSGAPPPTSATMNTRRNGKIVVPSARGG